MSEENNEKLNEYIQDELAEEIADAVETVEEGDAVVEETTAAAETTAPATEAAANPAGGERRGRNERGPRGEGGGGRRHNNKKKKTNKRRRNEEEAQSEFTEKVVQVRRVTKVVKGGKKLSFRTTVIIGNEKGKVGVGVGKAAEVLVAIKKALSDARKNLVDVETVANTNTISHAVWGESGGGKVLLKPAAEGTGIIAGGTARIVLELAGVGDILAKSQGSKSPLNVARATVNGLKQLRSFQEVANIRGLSVKQILFSNN